MRGSNALLSLSRPFIKKLPLSGSGSGFAMRMLTVAKSGNSNQLSHLLCGTLLPNQAKLIFSEASRREATRGVGFIKQRFDLCKAALFPHLIDLGARYRSRGPLFGVRFFHHTSRIFIRHEKRIPQISDCNPPVGNFRPLHFGAFIIGFSFFTYGAHRHLRGNHTLPALLTKPVYASAEFQRNNFIADVVEKAGSAVVFLEIKGRHPLTGRPVTLSNGSGFIVRTNGIILTNAHVVANKSSVSVKLQDGRVFEGQVTAVDPISDLAAVKISASGLPTIPLGNSTDIRPGEWVIAMGSPLSLSNTVTCGIVSSVQRASKELGLRNKNMDYIQTDAVINFGNSGGPLVNLDGKAIGINTMKVTTGISFAIPSDYAVKFLTKAESLMKTGKTENGFLKRRYMGITMLTLTESVMRDLRNNIRMPNFADVKGGVFVYKVIPGSPAHSGGILAGDIIIEISGVPIRSAADVYDAVEKADHLKVTVIRGNDKIVIAINTKETI